MLYILIFTHIHHLLQGIFGTRFNLPFRITTVADENEPFTIFGLRCAAPMCGGKKEGSVL